MTPGGRGGKVLPPLPTHMCRRNERRRHPEAAVTGPSTVCTRHRSTTATVPPFWRPLHVLATHFSLSHPIGQPVSLGVLR